MAEEIYAQDSNATVCAIPVADGGKGTVGTFLTAVGGQQVAAACTGPYGEPITSCYGLLPDGTAVVEMAAAAGLPMVGKNRSPERATTNDGGCGAAAALGIRFFNEKGESFVPVGATLKDIARISTEEMAETLRHTSFMTMCVIGNLLCGPLGASETDMAAAYGEGVSGVFPINPALARFEEVKAHCQENLRFIAANPMQFYHAVRTWPS